ACEKRTIFAVFGHYPPTSATGFAFAGDGDDRYRVQNPAGREHSLERRVGGRGVYRCAVHCRAVRGRVVYLECERRLGVWRGGFADRDSGVDLLLGADFVVWRGVHRSVGTTSWRSHSTGQRCYLDEQRSATVRTGTGTGAEDGSHASDGDAVIDNRQYR